MADFTIRSDNIDVEQIMRQIRMRIKEKRGVDYTEEEVRELANVKLEKFLNPRAVRSELVEHYRRQRPPMPLPLAPAPETYAFEADTIYQSHRAPILRRIRRLLNPVLKVFFNPNPVIQALHRQSKMNAYLLQQLDRVSERFVARDELDALNFEVLNNIVLELTRNTIEINNLRMRIEAMSARQEFNERRARAFEGMVSPPAGPPAAAGSGREGGAQESEDAEVRARRRRRRRGRRRPEGENAEARSGAPAQPADQPGRAMEPPADRAAGDAPARPGPPSDSGSEQ